MGKRRADNTTFLIVEEQSCVPRMQSQGPQPSGREADAAGAAETAAAAAGGASETTPAAAAAAAVLPPPRTKPFFGCALLLEAASPLLASALASRTTLADLGEPVTLRLSIAGTHSIRHHALFSLFAEHAYCGTIAKIADRDLLPLWSLAHFLEADRLKRYLLDTRLAQAMHASASLAIRAFDLSMSKPCDELQACSTCALLACLARPSRSLAAKTDVLRCMQLASRSCVLAPAGGAAAAGEDWLAASVARLMRDALLSAPRAAAAPLREPTAEELRELIGAEDDSDDDDDDDE